MLIFHKILLLRIRFSIWYISELSLRCFQFHSVNCVWRCLNFRYVCIMMFLRFKHCRESVIAERFEFVRKTSRSYHESSSWSSWSMIAYSTHGKKDNNNIADRNQLRFDRNQKANTQITCMHLYLIAQETRQGSRKLFYEWRFWWCIDL